MESYPHRIEQAIELIKGAKRVTAFTGAGISTESGISDFRSPGGVWDRYRIVTFQEFLSSHDSRVEYWKMKKELFYEMKDAKPNKAHLALAELERIGKLDCLITQNIDGLHQEAGSTNVIELHGTNRKAICVKCGKLWPIEEIQVILETGNLDPCCDVCNGYVKPATISFGQSMPEKDMIKAYECALQCDLFIMIGSSLQVEPAASMPREAKRVGAALIFINRTETPYDYMATTIFRESAGQVLAEIVEGLKK
ncbi:MAG: NAD-dependent deacylase [Nitrospirota bacterium]